MEKPSIVQVERRDTESRAAVIFLHGFTGDGPGTWGDLWPRIMKDPQLASWDAWLISYPTKFLPHFTLGMWRANADLNQLALMLSTVITNTDIRKYESIVFVAHSMGGLVAQRTLLNNADIAAKTHAVILFGTPSGGLETASRIKKMNSQIRDMAAGGEFITKLRSDWDANFGENPRFNFMAFGGTEDCFVPPTSSLDPFPKEHTKMVSGDHLSMIHPDEADVGASSLVVNCISNVTKTESQFDSAQLAIERCEFNRVVNELEPEVEKLDSRALVLLAIALDALGERDKAEKYLSAREDVGSDVLGTLGGRLKRKWLVSGRNRDHAKSAQHFYGKGLEIAKENEDLRQVYYLTINLAFLSLVADMSRKRAREYAREVLAACDACHESGDGDDWLAATEGEAHLILGEYETAYEKYRTFVEANKYAWRLASTYLNAQEIANALERSDVADTIDEIFPINGQ